MTQLEVVIDVSTPLVKSVTAIALEYILVVTFVEFLNTVGDTL